ncbi:MAG: HAMP domain-containing histidine kinase [Oscillospiraceae bacterium]|nr:HAMP domain-containing histidine kinase [Oscillospiraceae bacterium]
MEDNIDIANILNLLPQPIFCARNGLIVCRNQPAAQLFLEPQLPVAELLGEAAEDYARFQSGSLYLTLMLPGQALGACVSRLGDMDIFVVEQQTELQVMSLAAIQLRDPLSDVLSILQRLPSQKEFPYLGHLNRRLFQIQRLVFNMADAARYTSNYPGRMVYMDICAVVEELFQHIELLAAKNDIKLVYSCPREQILTMLNTEMLERALYNMVSNAMKATEKGGTIEAKLTWAKNRLYLCVRDFGSGIPESIQGTLYSRYLRQPGLDSRQEGLGLGMTLIRSAATAHGGTLLVDHPDEVGTRVTMSLSIQKNSENLLRSTTLPFDYAGEQDHGLLELADLLPPELYF